MNNRMHGFFAWTIFVWILSGVTFDYFQDDQCDIAEVTVSVDDD